MGSGRHVGACGASPHYPLLCKDCRTTCKVVHIVAYLVLYVVVSVIMTVRVRLCLHNIGSGMCRVCDAHNVTEPLACVTLSALYGVKCHAREEIVSLRRLIGRVSYR